MTGESSYATARKRPRPAKKAAFWSLVIIALAAQAAIRRTTGSPGAVSATSAAPLYVTSGASLRRFSLGYEGLLADIYWTRVIQYYGRSRLAGESRFEMLGPLLRVTTTLDPHLIVAYRFGAIFLAEKPPGGAGKPREAIELLHRGIVENPDYWRLWEDLGFIEYWDLRDYAAAARDFRIGAAHPGAPIWMKTLAASVSAQGGELRTSQILWSEVYRAAENQDIRRSALEHLAALKAEEEIRALDAILASYRTLEGSSARTFDDLIAAGLLRGAPRDPTGVPYALDPSGAATLGPSSKIDLRLAR